MNTDLQTFLKTTTDAREYQRAMAVMLALRGEPYAAIRQVLPISKPFISKWKKIYIERGTEGLRIGYRGSESYLTDTQRAEVLTWIVAHHPCNVTKLRVQIQKEYGVQYKSDQSYYALIHTAYHSYDPDAQTLVRCEEEEEEDPPQKRVPHYAPA